MGYITTVALVGACLAANAGTASTFALPRFVVSGRSRFAPSAWTTSTSATTKLLTSRRASGARTLQALVDPGMADGVDPAWLHHVVTGLADAAGSVLDSSGDVVGAATDVLKEEAKKGGGPIEALTSITEGSIVGLHDMLKGLGVPSPYGISIILFTVFVKGITFPLTYKQLASTTKMQTLAPKVKELQARYANNPEAANQAISQLYQVEDVNPLAGCLPTLAQIPIFISLYRSLLNLAKENKLTEPFLWIPSLEGPTFDAPPTETLNWIKEWSDGAPKLGWHDTLAYLTIPLILIVTQSISTQLMQPAKDPNAPADDSAAASQQVLKFLPLLIGWFSLNVPSALGLYWILNNFISTASSVIIRNKIATEMGTPSAGAPKISMPFMEAEPEAVTKSVIRETVQDADVVSSIPEPKGFAVDDGGEPQEIEGEVVDEAGKVVEMAASKPKPKPSKKRSKKKKTGCKP